MARKNKRVMTNAHVTFDGIPDVPSLALVSVTITCDRCHKAIDGLLGKSYTAGFYDTDDGYWSQFADKDEKYICDDCMWSDARYLSVYRESVSMEETDHG